MINMPVLLKNEAGFKVKSERYFQQLGVGLVKGDCFIFVVR